MKCDLHMFSWDSLSELSSEEMQADERPANMLSFKVLVTARKKGRFCAFAGIGCARSVTGSEEEGRWRAAGWGRQVPTEPDIME